MRAGRRRSDHLRVSRGVAGWMRQYRAAWLRRDILAGVTTAAVVIPQVMVYAAVAGLPITRLALFEPPFVVDDSRPPRPAGYVERLDAAVAAGRPGDAVELFMTGAVGMPAEVLAGLRESPFWPALEAVAHTIAYDGRIMGSTMSGQPLPADRWAAVAVPTLVMYGRDTEPWLIAAARALAALLPTASLQAVEGAQHNVQADVLAPVLRQFAAAGQAARG